MTPEELAARKLAEEVKALASMAHRGPVDAERELVDAWALYLGTGVPADPGWFAAADQLEDQDADAGQLTTLGTAALASVRDLDKARGLFCLRGGVGSGRSYACARLLWRRARQVAAGRGQIAGVWLDAPAIGELSDFRSKGDERAQWAPLLKRAKSAAILVVDDMGAAGSDGWVVRRLVALLEARFREARGLTVITTNVPEPAFSLAVGPRAMDRMTWREVEGSSLRKLGAGPEVPRRILAARHRTQAADELDHAARTGADASPECLAVARAWLRPVEASDDAWAARIAEELAEAARQREALGQTLDAAVAKLRAPTDGEREEREQAELERMRGEHRSKVETLRERDAV